MIHSIAPLPLRKNFQKSQTFSEKPLDKTKKVCYTIGVDRRGTDHLPLKVCALSPMVSFPIGPSRRACLTHFISFLWYRVGGAPDYRKGFHGDFLSDDGEKTCDCVERTHTR